MASILIVLIVMIRQLAIHKLPKRVFTILWSIVLFRLIMPFSIPTDFFTKQASVSMPEATFDSRLLESMILNSRDQLTAQNFIYQDQSFVNLNNISVAPYFWVWLIGFALFITYFFVIYVRYLREYKTSLPVQHPFIEQWLSNCLVKRKIEVRESDKIISPLTYGIFRPVILLPKDTDYNDKKHLNYVLTHELIHIKRFDVFYKWILVMTLCMHWFNPFVWLFYIFANRDLELSCDEAVVNTFGDTKKSDYALTLIQLAEKGSKWTPLSSNFSNQSIEERIVAIMKPTGKNLVSVLLTLALVLGVTFVTYADHSETRSFNLFEQVDSTDDLYQYANFVNGVYDEVYIDNNYDKSIMIENTVFTDHHVYALISLAGEITSDLEISGQITEKNAQSSQYLSDSFKELEAEDDVRYFLYHGNVSSHEINLQEYEGGHLDLNIRINGIDHDFYLTAPIVNVSTEVLLFIPEADQLDDAFYDTILLTPHELKMVGLEENLDNSEGEGTYPRFRITIIRAEGQDIHISYDTRGLIADEGFKIGGGGGTNGQGEFSYSWNFTNFELDLSEISSVIINDITYRVTK